MTATYLSSQRLAFFMLGLFAAGEVLGQSSFVPYVGEQIEHNSNIFALPNSTQAVAANGDPQLSDSDSKSTAGVLETYQLDRQVLSANLEGRYLAFDHFSYLDHFEYYGNLGLNWKLFSEFSGTLQASQERSMAPFANRDTVTQLALNVDRNIIANGAYQFAAEWRLEGGVDLHHLQAPLLDFPDYVLTETISHVAIKYVGFANLTYGVLVNYDVGQYENAPVAPSYIERDAKFTMTYAVSSLASFNGALGYTERDLSDDQGRISSPLTGSLGYYRKVGGKTSINASISRNANSYVGGGGSELDTTGAIAVEFQPTYKTRFNASFQETYSKFVGQTVPGADSVGRKDRTPVASVKGFYQATRWLLIQPYANYVRRGSNIELFHYASTIVGIDFVVKRPAPINMPFQQQ